MRKVISIFFLCFLFGTSFGQTKKPVSHFPTKYDKDPGFYTMQAEDDELNDILPGEDGSYGDDAMINDYEADFDEDRKEYTDDISRFGYNFDVLAEHESVPVREGKYTWFNEDDGKVIARSNYKDGRLHGAYKKYNDEGQLITEMAYEKGRSQGKATLYYDNGVVKSTTYYNKGRLNGMFNKFNENGNLIASGLFIKGKKEGAHNTYYADGSIKTITNYANDTKNGQQFEYDEQGNVTSTINFINGSPEGSTGEMISKQKRDGTRFFKIRMDKDKEKSKIEKGVK